MAQSTTDANQAALDEAYKLIGVETSHEGVDEVTRSDIRRKLEVFCFDCPIHYDDEVARALTAAPWNRATFYSQATTYLEGAPPV